MGTTREFIDYYLEQARALSKDVGFVPLAEAEYVAVEKAFTAAK